MSFDIQQVRFLQRLVEAGYDRRRVGAVSQYLSEQYSIGVIIGDTVHYRPEHLAAAAGLLKSHDLPVSALPVDASRADVASFGGLSEKAFSVAPHAQSVAVKFIGACTFNGHLIGTPAGAYMVLRPEQALSATCSKVMVVENFETFRTLESYSWIQYDASVMVVFRGDPTYSIADAATVLAGRVEPLHGFFDFDPAGLAMASALPLSRLERLVLPGATWLRSAAGTARGRQLFADQVDIYGATLDQSSNPVVAEAWSLCRSLRSAVTQERMMGAPAKHSLF